MSTEVGGGGDSHFVLYLVYIYCIFKAVAFHTSEAGLISQKGSQLIKATTMAQKIKF